MGKTNFKKVKFDFEALDKCPLCDCVVSVPNGHISWFSIDFWYVVCPQCGLKFMNPRPTLKSYRDFYKNLFWQQKIRNIGFHQSGQAWQAGKYKWDNEKEWKPESGRQNMIEKTRALRVETTLGILNKYLKLNNKTNILDVGCAYPVVLQALKKKYKCNVYGVEPSEDVRATVKKQGDEIKFLGYYAEDLKKIGNQKIKFDAIIFSHVLENTIDPAMVIKYAQKCLNPGGLVYIQTPNLLVNDQMNPYHPYIFSNNPLKLIAQKAELKYVRITKPIDRMLTAVFLKER